MSAVSDVQESRAAEAAANMPLSERRAVEPHDRAWTWSGSHVVVPVKHGYSIAAQIPESGRRRVNGRRNRWHNVVPDSAIDAAAASQTIAGGEDSFVSPRPCAVGPD